MFDVMFQYRFKVVLHYNFPSVVRSVVIYKVILLSPSFSTSLKVITEVIVSKYRFLDSNLNFF